MALTNTQPAEASSFGMTFSEMSRLTRAMMMEAPSSTPRIGRKESARYSKKESSHATLPRALERASALTSALLFWPSPDAEAAPAFAISGRCMMFSYTVATPPPMKTWKRSPLCGTAPSTPFICSRAFWSTLDASASSKRSRVAQCVRLRTFSGPPIAVMICDARESAILIPFYFLPMGFDDAARLFCNKKDPEHGKPMPHSRSCV